MFRVVLGIDLFNFCLMIVVCFVLGGCFLVCVAPMCWDFCCVYLVVGLGFGDLLGLVFI